MKKVILLTGASSGIGHQIAKLLAQNGYKVYGGARRIPTYLINKAMIKITKHKRKIYACCVPILVKSVDLVPVGRFGQRSTQVLVQFQ